MHGATIKMPHKSLL